MNNPFASVVLAFSTDADPSDATVAPGAVGALKEYRHVRVLLWLYRARERRGVLRRGER